VRRLLLWVGAIVLVGAGFALAEAVSGTNKHTSRAAPALPTEVLHGPPVSLTTLRGHPAIVHFWASWCGPCTKEAPELAQLGAQLDGKATLVGVDWSDSPAGARRFIRRHHWTFANLEDRDGASGNAYGISGLPTTLILDRQGRIRARLTGPQTARGLLRHLQ
jgi:thiol-disulfide isomerase/thioredoxin